MSINRLAIFRSFTHLVAQKYNGKLSDPVTEIKLSILADESYNKLSAPLKTFFNSQSILSELVLKAPWIQCSPQGPLSMSWDFSFSIQWLFSDSRNFRLVWGPPIETWIILLGSNKLTALLNLVKLSSAIVCPKNCVFNNAQKLDCWCCASIWQKSFHLTGLWNLVQTLIKKNWIEIETFYFINKQLPEVRSYTKIKNCLQFGY